MHTHEVISALDRVLGHVVDAETGERGFLITGRDGYLEPYDAALVRYDAQRCALDRLSAATWTDPVRWRDLRRVAREGGCRQGVRAVARDRT